MKQSHILPTLLMLSINKSPRNEKSLLLLLAALFSKCELKFHSFSRWPLRAGVVCRAPLLSALFVSKRFFFLHFRICRLLTLEFRTKDKSFSNSQEPAQTLVPAGTSDCLSLVPQLDSISERSPIIPQEIKAEQELFSTKTFFLTQPFCSRHKHLYHHTFLCRTDPKTKRPTAEQLYNNKVGNIFKR